MKKKLSYIITLSLFLLCSFALGSFCIYAKYKQEKEQSTSLSFQKSYLNISNPQTKEFILDENQRFSIEVSNTLYGNMTPFDLIYDIEIVDEVHGIENTLLQKSEEELKATGTENKNIYSDLLLSSEGNEIHHVTVTLTSTSGYHQFIQNTFDVSIATNLQEKISYELLDMPGNIASIFKITIPDLYRKRDVTFNIQFPATLVLQENSLVDSLTNENLKTTLERGGNYTFYFFKEDINQIYTLDQFQIRW